MQSHKEKVTHEIDVGDRSISIITGPQATRNDIHEAGLLDALVYDDIYHVDATQCEECSAVNPDIYVMAKDNCTNRVIAYVNISPLKNGNFIDAGITADVLLSYDMPFPYSVYFSLVVIHLGYQNTEVFMQSFNAIGKKFIYLGEYEVYVRRMAAGAITKNGEKFCRLFGMNKVRGSNHESVQYEITMIPPEFRVLTKMSKQLYEYYQRNIMRLHTCFRMMSNSFRNRSVKYVIGLCAGRIVGIPAS